MSDPTDPEQVELLPLQAGDLDEALLDQLLFDIEHAAELFGVQVKARPGTYVEAGSPTLAEASQLLKGGAVMAIQLRYRAESGAWCDTVLRTPTGFRIVRARDLTESPIVRAPEPQQP